MPPPLLSSSTPTAGAGPSSSSFLPADRRAARRGLWRDWANAPEQGSLFAVGDPRGGDGRGGSSAAAAVSEWATAWLAASTAESDLTSMLHNEVMVRGRGLGSDEAAVKRERIFDKKRTTTGPKKEKNNFFRSTSTTAPWRSCAGPSPRPRQRPSPASPSTPPRARGAWPWRSSSTPRS